MDRLHGIDVRHGGQQSRHPSDGGPDPRCRSDRDGVGAAASAPALLFGLVAGVWVDRLRRRRILIVADLARAVLLLSVPLAWASGFLSLAYLSLIAFLVGTFGVFFDVAHSSYLPSLVSPDELVDGNSKLEVSELVTQAIEPSTGGLLVQVISAPLAVAVDAVSFVASALFIGAIRTWFSRLPNPARPGRTSSPRSPGAFGSCSAIRSCDPRRALPPLHRCA